MKKVTWKTTLHDSVRGFGGISDLAATCHKLGYPYMCWNGRIYFVSKQERGTVKWVDTNLLAEDVGKNYTPTIKDFVVLACAVSSGEPTMVCYDVEYTRDQYNEGEHYEMAKTMAEEEGYEAPFVCFDSSEYYQVIKMAEKLNER